MRIVGARQDIESAQLACRENLEQQPREAAAALAQRWSQCEVAHIALPARRAAVARASLSLLFRGERARVRGGRLLRRRNMPPPLTPTLSPLRRAMGRGRRWRRSRVGK